MSTILKQDQAFQHVPIVIFTGRDQVVDQDACRSCGADSFIPKSAGADALLQELAGALQRVQRPAA